MKPFAILALTLSLVSLNALARGGGKESDGLPCPKCGTNAAAIYEALDVAEVYATPEGYAGVSTYAKSVGGLECERSHVVYPNAPETYTCKLGADDRDDQAIYEALNVEERNGTPKGILGVSTLVKSVGSLTCYRRSPVVPHPVSHYQCILK